MKALLLRYIHVHVYTSLSQSLVILNLKENDYLSLCKACCSPKDMCCLVYLFGDKTGGA